MHWACYGVISLKHLPMSMASIVFLNVVPLAAGRSGNSLYVVRFLACRGPACWTNYFATMFRLHRIARSSTTLFADLLLVCYLVNTTCAIITLIFIILIVSRSHALFPVVAVRSFLHALVAVEAKCYFQHTPAVQSNDFASFQQLELRLFHLDGAMFFVSPRSHHVLSVKPHILLQSEGCKQH